MNCIKCNATLNGNLSFCPRCEEIILAESEIRDRNKYNFSSMLEAAKVGDPNAQAKIGLIYLFGSSLLKVQNNPTEAHKWFGKAMGQNHADGYYGMAGLYFSGTDKVVKDTIITLELLNKAVNLGSLGGIGFLGLLNLYGMGLEANVQKGLSLIKTAASKGDPRAIAYLGRCYKKGSGVIKNEVEAFRLCNLASNMDDTSAHLEMGHAYKDGIGCNKNAELAIEYFDKACFNSRNYKYRAIHYADLGKYEAAIMDYYEYYKYNEFDVCDYAGLGFTEDWLTKNENFIKNNLIPSFSKDEHLVLYSPAHFLQGETENQSIYRGTSYTDLYGTFGTGYITLSNRNIYIGAFVDMTLKYPMIEKKLGKGLVGWFLGRTTDYRKAISHDYSLKIPYDRLQSYHVDKDNTLVIQAGDQFSLWVYEYALLQEGLHIGKNNLFDRKPAEGSNDDSMIVRLKKLKKLYEEGILSKDEYEQRRAKLLEEMEI